MKLKHIRTGIIAVALMFSGAFALPLASETASANVRNEIRNGANATNANTGANLQTIIQRVTNVLLFLIGAVAVIMIIIGGLKYVTSNGDQAAMTSAKNTILYAAVGLILAIAAFAIADFVIDVFIPTNNTTP